MKKLAPILLLSAIMVLLPLLLRRWWEMVVAGLNPTVSFVVLLLSGLAAVALFGWFIRRLGRWYGPGGFPVPLLFGIAAVAWLVDALIFEVVVANFALDIQLHYTYYVISNFDLTFWATVYFGVMGLVYYFLLRSLKRPFQSILARAAFWITYVCAGMLIEPPLALPCIQPRRYVYVSDIFISNMTRWSKHNDMLSLIVLILAAAQLLFVIDILSAIINRRRPAPSAGGE